MLPCLLIVAAVIVGAVVLARRPARTIRPLRGLVGVRGVVTAAIPLGGFGEIRARVGDRSLRLRARSDRPLPLGTAVIVIQQMDESTVLVRELPPLGR
jgi:membrane protein implicated in regulation of membrane protease activity